MANPFLASRTRRSAAKHRLAARYASKYHGASGYERGWVGFVFNAPEFLEGIPACDAGFSRPPRTICSEGLA
jgi:hypothetical protein